jgi:uncharacterized membrane protein
MKKIILSIIILFIFLAPPLSAQEDVHEDGDIYNEIEIAPYQPEENFYYKAKVIKILDSGHDEDPLLPVLEKYYQELLVEFLDGPNKGKVESIRFIPRSLVEAEQNLRVGEKVVVIESEYAGAKDFAIADRYRIDSVIWLAIIFLILVIIFAGYKGIRSIFGLAFTLLVIFYYILPRIISGQDPFIIFLLGGMMIALFSIYLGHGFNRRTSIAVVSTMITLLLSVALAILAIKFTHLFGLGSEEAFYVQVGELGNINLRGLLLGGIIIGVLGVLDDITTAQAAVVQEIYRANDKLKFLDLAKRGLSVGHEHIISLVNTLALAYVGASLPLLLLFSQKYAPLWVTLNSERVVEELVRTLVGSSALIIAVPITTYLAAYCFHRFGIGKDNISQTHQH